MKFPVSRRSLMLSLFAGAAAVKAADTLLPAERLVATKETCRAGALQALANGGHDPRPLYGALVDADGIEIDAAENPWYRRLRITQPSIRFRYDVRGCPKSGTPVAAFVINWGDFPMLLSRLDAKALGDKREIVLLDGDSLAVNIDVVVDVE